MVAASIHAGHELREEVRDFMHLNGEERLREEDPFTDQWTDVADTRIIVHRSRFECDMNRPREGAVYLEPHQAWGLTVWKEPLPPDVLNRSLAFYDSFYTEIRRLFDDIIERQGILLLLDLHSYNHRREGPLAPPAPQELNPEVNVGTYPDDRTFWAPLIERFMDDLRKVDFMGRHLDVRENVKFRGGFLSRWLHQTYPLKGCALAIEFKKTFMDEWSGIPDPAHIRALREALARTIPGLQQELAKLKR